MSILSNTFIKKFKPIENILQHKKCIDLNTTLPLNTYDTYSHSIYTLLTELQYFNILNKNETILKNQSFVIYANNKSILFCRFKKKDNDNTNDKIYYEQWDFVDNITYTMYNDNLAYVIDTFNQLYQSSDICMKKFLDKKYKYIAHGNWMRQDMKHIIYIGQHDIADMEIRISTKNRIEYKIKNEIDPVVFKTKNISEIITIKNHYFIMSQTLSPYNILYDLSDILQFNNLYNLNINKESCIDGIAYV
uniref:Uncharacterized protein n=1 Tax=Faxonius propinquus nudivirus TaxID=3139431 RepID=A0AAU8GD16_9VIRU